MVIHLHSREMTVDNPFHWSEAQVPLLKDFVVVSKSIYHPFFRYLYLHLGEFYCKYRYKYTNSWILWEDCYLRFWTQQKFDEIIPTVRSLFFKTCLSDGSTFTYNISNLA